MSDTPNKPGFTPGPWKRVWRRGCEIRPAYYVIQHGNDGEVVAETDNDEPNQYQDACLIAASPDLYYEAEQNVKAMESLLAHLESCDEYCLGVDEQQNYPYRNEAIHSLKTRIGHTKASLAKARGGDA